MTTDNITRLHSSDRGNHEHGTLRGLIDRCDSIAGQATALRQEIEDRFPHRDDRTHSSVAPQLLAAPQAAEYLSIGVSSLYRLAQSGALRPVRIGPKTTRYRRVDLDAYIDGLDVRGGHAS